MRTMLALGTASSAVHLGTSAPAQPRLTLGSRQLEPRRAQGEKSEVSSEMIPPIAKSLVETWFAFLKPLGTGNG